MRKRWTKKMLGALRRAYTSGLSVRKIGPEFGVSGERILQVMRQHGIKRRSRNDYRIERSRGQVLGASRCRSMIEACRLLAVSDDTARRLFQEAGLPEPNGNCVLRDPRKLARAIRLYEAGKINLIDAAVILGGQKKNNPGHASWASKILRANGVKTHGSGFRKKC